MFNSEESFSFAFPKSTGFASGAGLGGALALLQVASLRAANLSFSGCAGTRGGAIYVATRGGDESAAAAAALVVNGLSYDANRAVEGGGNEYYETGSGITRLGAVRRAGHPRRQQRGHGAASRCAARP